MYDKIAFPQDTIFYGASVNEDNPGILWQIKKSKDSLDITAYGPLSGKTVEEQISFIEDFAIRGGIFFTSEKVIITVEDILNGIL